MSQEDVDYQIMPMLMEAESKVFGNATKKAEAASSGPWGVENPSVLQFSAFSRGIDNGVFNRVAAFLAVTPSTFDGCCF